MRQYNFPRPIYSKDLKDIPERLGPHEWLRTIDFNKLPRYQLKVRMCCPKCEEMVKEEIWEARGVVDVMVFRADKKVVVTGMPECPDKLGFEGRDGWLDPNQVLRRARKIDCKAKFVPLDQPVVVRTTPPVVTTVVGPRGPPGPEGPRGPQGPQGPQGPPARHVATYPPSFPISDYARYPPHASAQDDNTPFYFFLFLVLLLSLLVFRR